jgi:hypothetical protein
VESSNSNYRQSVAALKYFLQMVVTHEMEKGVGEGDPVYVRYGLLALEALTELEHALLLQTREIRELKARVYDGHGNE